MLVCCLKRKKNLLKMSLQFDYTEKVVLITGSSSGIGESIAKRMAELGAFVVITGRSKENINRVANECLQLSPKKSKPLEVVADITNDDDAKRLIQSTIDMFGRLDLLINNAGYAQVTSVFDPKSLETFEKVIRLDVRATINLTLMAIPYLEQTKGNIINISSVCSLKPLVGFYGYCMAKAAIDMFTRVIAMELGPKGIRVNSINPGGVQTNFFTAIGFNSEQVMQQEEYLRKSSPLGMMGEPNDIADLVAYVGSNHAKFMTGSCLLIDGGALFSSLALAT
ncbi:3-oxoacyl-[acyl-carrier-protein] reductase FabG-like [Dermatophagoides pteronyssinus]|uniref:Tetratricopeptide repeat domain 27 n=1 Tax=Dermatophagoides pteronyssinus TaxID=6956 RepID=A0ABQ8J8A4_DERPT|nr:Tetratricopeptide repeat domain 27 [Dermatophagoides pteronyssinus]